MIRVLLYACLSVPQKSQKDPATSTYSSNVTPLTSLGLQHMVGDALGNESRDLQLPSVTTVNWQWLNESIITCLW